MRSVSESRDEERLLTSALPLGLDTGTVKGRQARRDVHGGSDSDLRSEGPVKAIRDIRRAMGLGEAGPSFDQLANTHVAPPWLIMSISECQPMQLSCAYRIPRRLLVTVIVLAQGHTRSTIGIGVRTR